MARQFGKNVQQRVQLTHRFLETLKATGVAYRIGDARCSGLAARVAPSGVVTFDLAFRIAKSKGYRRVSLGTFPGVTLEAARDRANDLTRAARAGRDLIAEEDHAKKSVEGRIKVRALIEEHLTRRVRGRLRTADAFENRLLRTLKPLLDRPADDVRRRDLRELLDAVADAGQLREVDHRRVCLRRLFGWALSQDYITTDPTIGLQSYSKPPPRQRVLSTDEIRALWNWLDGQPIREDAADVLRTQCCLGARVSEVGGMAREEFDTENWLWTLPPERSKNRKPRVTPIVGIAREIIAKRIAGRPQGPLFLTENNLPIGSHHMAITLRDHRPPFENFGTHDLRRTMATELVESLGVSLETTARVLGHVAGGATTRVLVAHYIAANFIEQKTHALLAWDARLRSIISGDIAPAGNVVALAETRRAIV